ncbi:hypothetical protein VPH35_108292 [Triticum aestivum]
MVACAERLGVPRGSRMFRYALQAVAFRSKEKIAAKVSIALSKAPLLLRRSKEHLQRTSNFLISEVGLEPAYIARLPALITYSLEGRLRPRHYAVKFLTENGLLDHGGSYYVIFKMTEKVFVEKYICPHKEAVLHLAKYYAAACRGEVPAH